MTAGTSAPTRPQHLRALARANEIRLARAGLKRRIAEGDVTAAQMILDTPWEAESMPVIDLLMSQRRWGETRCRKVLASVPVSEIRPVGALTARQREALARRLDPSPRTAECAQQSAPAVLVGA